MRHHRDGTGVGAGSAGKDRPHIALGYAPRRVGPVQRRVYWQQVRQVVAVRVHQLIDPLHAHRRIPVRLDGERRRVVEQQPPLACRANGAVTPDGRGGQPGRQDLLLELPHRDFVVIRVLAALDLDRARLRHDRRDEQWACVLCHSNGVQCASRERPREGSPEPQPFRQEQSCARQPTDLEELPSIHRNLSPRSIQNGIWGSEARVEFVNSGWAGVNSLKGMPMGGG